MKLIVGLGNPGIRYRNTRHNVGFKVIDRLARKNKIRLNKRRAHCIIGEGFIGRKRVVLAKPQDYMNLSGFGVRGIMKSCGRLTLDELFVVADDVNLSLGSLRIRPSGSAGGHNGLKSIISELGAQDFVRLRIGVGREGLRGDITNFVLGRFTKKEDQAIDEIIETAVCACECWVGPGIKTCMNDYNKKQ